MIDVVLDIDVNNNRVEITNTGHAEEEIGEKNIVACTTISELMGFLYLYNCHRLNANDKNAVLKQGYTHLVFEDIKDDETDIFWGLRDYLMVLDKNYYSISVEINEK